MCIMIRTGKEICRIVRYTDYLKLFYSGSFYSFQSFEQGTSKRAAEMGGFDGGTKRVKSDTDT